MIWDFEKALKLMLLSNTAPIQDLPAPSYVYAILMDGRMRQNDYWFVCWKIIVIYERILKKNVKFSVQNDDKVVK